MREHNGDKRHQHKERSPKLLAQRAPPRCSGKDIHRRCDSPAPCDVDLCRDGRTCELRPHRCQTSFSLERRDARLWSRQDPKPRGAGFDALGTLWLQLRQYGNGQSQIGRLPNRCARETRGTDADDRDRSTANQEPTSDSARITPESSQPVAVADYDDGDGAGLVIFLGQQTAGGGFQAERFVVPPVTQAPVVTSTASGGPTLKVALLKPVNPENRSRRSANARAKG